MSSSRAAPHLQFRAITASSLLNSLRAESQGRSNESWPLVRISPRVSICPECVRLKHIGFLCKRIDNENSQSSSHPDWGRTAPGSRASTARKGHAMPVLLCTGNATNADAERNAARRVRRAAREALLGRAAGRRHHERARQPANVVIVVDPPEARAAAEVLCLLYVLFECGKYLCR